MVLLSLLLLSLLSSVLSIRTPPKESPLDIHINVDVAETSFNFASEWLSIDSVVTLAWKDTDNPYLPKKEEVITHYEGELEWMLEMHFSDMWIPHIKKSMEEDEYRRARTKASEVTFWKNGTVELRFFYSAVIPCSQTSLLYPWDEYECGIYLANMESDKMYTLSPYNREKSFNISSSRAMSQHRIVSYTSTISSSLVQSNDRVFRTHGVKFECTIQRDQSRVIYSKVIPALCLIFFDAFIFITNHSPFYCLLLIIPLLLQIQFFASTLVNKLPYLVILVIARTFLSIITSIGRLVTSVLSRLYPDEMKVAMDYDSPLCRIIFLVVSTLIVFLAMDYSE